MLAETRDAYGDLVSEALVQKRTGVLSKKVRMTALEQIRQMKVIMAALRDNGKTLIWEIFAGEGNTTSVAIHGGHVAGEMIDLCYGYDIREKAVRRAILQMVDVYKPWLSIVAFPCTGHSPIRAINEAQGFERDPKHD